MWDYLQPFPPLGIGFQRLIFVLYKQEKKLDFSSLKKQTPWYVNGLGSETDSFFYFKISLVET